MDENFNIEEQFRKAFDEYREEPSGDLWGRVQNSLDEMSESGDTGKYSTLFEWYRVTPSAAVWHNIVRMLDAGIPVAGSLMAKWMNQRVFGTSLNLILSGLLVIVASLIPALPGVHENTPKKVMPAVAATRPGMKNSLVTKSQPGKEPVKGIEKLRIPGKQGTRIPETVSALPGRPVTGNPTLPGLNKPGNSVTGSETGLINEIATNPNKPAGEKLTRFHSIKKSIAGPRNVKPAFSTISRLQVMKFKKHNDSLYRDFRKKYYLQKDYLWYAGLMFEPRYSDVELIRGNAPFSYPVKSFSESESSAPGYKLGAIFGHKYNHFIFETGINYELRKTQAAYNLVYERIDTIINMGDTQVSIKNVPFLVRTDNEHKFVEIPLAVGFSVPYRKSAFLVKTGVTGTFQVSFSQNVNKSSELYPEQIPYPALNPVHWTWFVNLEYNYAFIDRFTLFAAPSFRIPINSAYRDYPVQRTFSSWGLLLGIYYNFYEKQPDPGRTRTYPGR